jgi:hypothetical protein
MENRSVRWIGLAILIVLEFIALRPYVEDRLYSANTPRSVEPRGSLADYEKSTIEIFQRVSPSVVQVVGQVGGNKFGQLGSPSTGEAEPRGSSCVLYDAYNTFCTIHIRNILNATNEWASGVCRTVQVVQSIFLPFPLSYIHGEKTLLLSRFAS